MLSATWSASSRVGVMTRARTGWRAGDMAQPMVKSGYGKYLLQIADSQVF